MLIQETMTQNPVTVRSDASVLTAARVMRDHGFGSLPVIEKDRLVGLVTDRDLVLRCVAEDLDTSTTEVASVMSKQLLFIRNDQTVADALEIMSLHQVRRLPVIDRNDRLVGIVSLGHLAETGDDPARVCETIGAVRQPASL